MVLFKVVGEVLYSLSTWFWLVAPSLCFTWFVVLRYVGPAAVVACFAAASLASVLARGPWPAFEALWVWKYVRGPRGFNFVVRGAGATSHGPRGRVIWATYPHGHLALAASLWFLGNPLFGGRCKGAIHDGVFYVPVLGALFRWGRAISVSESAIRGALGEGNSVIMCSGGVLDAANTGNTVKRRRGFLRIARELRVPVVPVWFADSRSYYSQWLPLGRSMERWFGLPFPLFVWGRWWCPLLPRLPAESRIYVGKPVMWPENATEEHDALYWDALEALQRQADADTAAAEEKKKKKNKEQ